MEAFIMAQAPARRTWRRVLLLGIVATPGFWFVGWCALGPLRCAIDLPVDSWRLVLEEETAHYIDATEHKYFVCVAKGGVCGSRQRLRFDCGRDLLIRQLELYWYPEADGRDAFIRIDSLRSSYLINPRRNTYFEVRHLHGESYVGELASAGNGAWRDERDVITYTPGQAPQVGIGDQVSCNGMPAQKLSDIVDKSTVVHLGSCIRGTFSLRFTRASDADAHALKSGS